jgi:hypothetical protein
VHSRITKITLVVACSIAIAQAEASARSAASEVGADRAWKLASMYYHRHVSGCGGVGDVVARGKYWDAPVHFGFAGEFQGYIRVNRRTGTVSYSGHPTVSAQSLDDWFARETKRPRAP